jgi:hypothetical protein
VQRPLDGAGDDVSPRVLDERMVEDAEEQQRPSLHDAEHRTLPPQGSSRPAVFRESIAPGGCGRNAIGWRAEALSNAAAIALGLNQL